MHSRKPSFLKKASKGRAVDSFFLGLKLKMCYFCTKIEIGTNLCNVLDWSFECGSFK